MKFATVNHTDSILEMLSLDARTKVVTIHDAIGTDYLCGIPKYNRAYITLPPEPDYNFTIYRQYKGTK